MKTYRIPVDEYNEQTHRFETVTREMKGHEIEIDGIPCVGIRHKNAPSYAKWDIIAASTGVSIMPPSWPGSYSAGTLAGAIQIVQNEVIDRRGKEQILQRIREINEAKHSAAA